MRQMRAIGLPNLFRSRLGVLKIDQANESAKAFFTTIGREDVVEQLADARETSVGTGNNKLAMDATARWGT